MSATLGALLTILEPTWRVGIYERLDEVALESSNPWNNAGTGHAALCELNYTPERKDGSVDISKAVKINEQFHTSREFWNHLLTAGLMEGTDFINVTPHMTFVRGADNVDFLRRRFDALSAHPLFRDMEFSSDPAVIGSWAPLMTLDRDADEPIAATRAAAGTDVDFGSLTKKLIGFATSGNTELHVNHEVRGLKKLRDGRWRLTLNDRSWNAGTRRRTVTAKFVFVGAGVKNLDLTGYLVGQVAAAPETKFHELQRFMPTAQPADWEKITAGQRVQVIKWVKGKGGVLEFGTEVVASADGTIAGLLGASPGASTAVAAMTGLLERCFPAKYDEWKPQLTSMMPSLGGGVADDAAQLARADKVPAGA